MLLLSIDDPQSNFSLMSEQPKQKRKRDEKEAPRPVSSCLLRGLTLQKQKKKKASQEEEGLIVRWQSAALQADLLVEKLRTLNPKMSSIEIGERSISGNLFGLSGLIV